MNKCLRSHIKWERSNTSGERQLYPQSTFTHTNVCTLRLSKCYATHLNPSSERDLCMKLADAPAEMSRHSAVVNACTCVCMCKIAIMWSQLRVCTYVHMYVHYLIQSVDLLISLTLLTFSSVEQGFAWHKVGHSKVSCHAHYKRENHPITSRMRRRERERGSLVVDTWHTYTYRQEL